MCTGYIALIMPMTVVQLLLITHHTVPFVVWVISGIILASLGVSISVGCDLETEDGFLRVLQCCDIL